MQFQTMSSFPKPAWPPAPLPHSPEKTAQRNLFHLRRKTGRCLVLSVWIDVCVSVSLVSFDNSAQVLSSYFNGLKTRQPLQPQRLPIQENLDRKSTRLNSSHHSISYAVFCLKKKK